MVEVSTSKINPNAFPTTPPDRESKRIKTSSKAIISSRSFSSHSVNVGCLLGCYHALKYIVAQVLPAVPEDPSVPPTRAIQDSRDVSRFLIRCGLDTTCCLGQAISTSVALWHHASMRSKCFSRDVQASLMDMPFDCSHLFDKKIDSVLGQGHSTLLGSI